MKPVIVYISGAHQHSGKTSTSIGLLSLLSRIFPPEELGYIKPVGQQIMQMNDGSVNYKDVQIIGKFSQIPSLDLEVIAPVQFSPSFTRTYLDSDRRSEITAALKANISKAMSFLSGKKFIIAEGTGHPGVGSIVGLSNADVSKMLDADILYIASGGIGRAADNMEVDLSYFKYKQCRLKGVIFNKIIEDKMPLIKKYMTEDFINERFRSRPDLPVSVLGYLPRVKSIMNPSMSFLRKFFKDHKPIGDTSDELWKKPVNNIKVISLVSEILNLEDFIEPGDIVLVAIMSRNRRSRILNYASRMKGKMGGLILTSARMYSLSDEIENMIKETGIPAFAVREDTAAAEQILLNAYANTKLQVFDEYKINEIKKLYEKNIDFDRFLDTYRPE